METTDLILRFAVLFVCLRINLVSGGKFKAIVRLNRTPFIRKGFFFFSSLIGFCLYQKFLKGLIKNLVMLRKFFFQVPRTLMMRLIRYHKICSNPEKVKIETLTHDQP